MRTWTALFLLAACMACVPQDQLTRPGPIEDVQIKPGNEFHNRREPQPNEPRTPDPEPETTPGEMIAWMAYPAQQQRSNQDWGQVLTDIVNHLPSSYGDVYWSSDRISWAHETTHGINGHLRNNFNETGETANAFYVVEDKAAILVEPNIRKSQVAEFVPELLRGPRFDDHIVGRTDWDDRPLYVFDEWVAFTNGGATGVDMVQRGLWTFGWRDGVSGQLEFTVYAIATAMAIEAYDPDYFLNNVEFKELLAFQIRRSMEIFAAGSAMGEFSLARQDTYFDELRNAQEAEPIRAFCRRIFGTRFTNEALLRQ